MSSSLGFFKVTVCSSEHPTGTFIHVKTVLSNLMGQVGFFDLVPVYKIIYEDSLVSLVLKVISPVIASAFESISFRGAFGPNILDVERETFSFALSTKFIDFLTIAPKKSGKIISNYKNCKNEITI